MWDLPLIREIGLYLPRMHVSGDWYVNYADGAARVHVEADLAWRFGLRTGDPALSAHGAYAASRNVALGRVDEANGGPTPLSPRLIYMSFANGNR